MLFTDDNFELMPVEGDIWPGNTAVVTVVFRPTEPKHYQQVCNHFTSAFIVTSVSHEQNVIIIIIIICSSPITNQRQNIGAEQ